MARTKRAGRVDGVPFTVEVVDAATLKPHPRNYKAHPDDQLEHIGALLREHGFFKNVVAAREASESRDAACATGGPHTRRPETAPWIERKRKKLSRPSTASSRRRRSWSWRTIPA